jgi:hypothetical protein
MAWFGGNVPAMLIQGAGSNPGASAYIFETLFGNKLKRHISYDKFDILNLKNHF